MKLYFTKGACSFAIRTILNELDLDCDYIAVNLKEKTTKDGKDYFEINPKGSVPALELDNGQILTEIAVILQYLANENPTSNILPKVGDFQRYRVLEWVNFVSTELHKTVGALFHPAVTEEMKEKIYLPIIRNKLKFTEQSLKEGSFLAGEQFTIADAYFYTILTWVFNLKISLEQCPKITAYFHRLSERDSITKSKYQEK